MGGEGVREVLKGDIAGGDTVTGGIAKQDDMRRGIAMDSGLRGACQEGDIGEVSK